METGHLTTPESVTFIKPNLCISSAASKILILAYQIMKIILTDLKQQTSWNQFMNIRVIPF
jgi:hypothetical protein